MNDKKIILAFFAVCFSWTFSWMALKYQAQSHVSINTSMAYRFLLAGMMCFLIAKKLGYSLSIPRKCYKYIAISAFFNGFFNFYLGYKASQYISSGMIAAISSMSIISNELFESFMEKKSPSKTTIKSGIVAIIGLMMFIYPTLEFSNGFFQSIFGSLLGVLMAVIVAPGYYCIKKATNEGGVKILVCMAYIFTIGGFMSLLSAFLQNDSLAIDPSISYISSLLFLTIFASCVAYAGLFYLIYKIGPAKAGYTAPIYTVGAIIVSTIFEDYSWRVINFAGFFLIFISIYMQFGKNKHLENKKL